ncbi:MAG: helix-turn-helix transcriptional regulator [Betaproteobacteria bacterium]
MPEETTTPQVAFGRVLRAARLKASISQEGLALDSTVQRQFISLIERDENQPTISTIFRLASALHTRPSELMALTEAEMEKSGQGQES